MSKKQSKVIKVNKAAKPSKTKPASKKAKLVKPAKKLKIKKVAKVVKKTIEKKAAKAIVKKKPTIKKAVKPVKKAIAKKTPVAAKVESAKKIALKKPISSKSAISVKKSQKIELKPVKKDIKKEISKPEKSIKEEKKATGKPEKLKKSNRDGDDDFEIIEKVKVKSSRKKGGRKPKGSGDDDEPEIIHDELVEQLIRSTKKLRQPKKPKFIQTFTNPRASLAVVLKDTNNKKGSLPKKEPKGKYELEYVAHTSAGILFEFLTTPSGLSEWFADDVNIQDGVFTFFWDGSEQKARLLSFKEEKFVRFQWFDKPDGTYFEFRIEKDELTGDISLIIVDFADEAADMKTSKLLWDSQVTKLLHVIGSY